MVKIKDSLKEDCRRSKFGLTWLTLAMNESLFSLALVTIGYACLTTYVALLLVSTGLKILGWPKNETGSESFDFFLFTKQGTAMGSVCGRRANTTCAWTRTAPWRCRWPTPRRGTPARTFAPSATKWARCRPRLASPSRAAPRSRSLPTWASVKRTSSRSYLIREVHRCCLRTATLPIIVHEMCSSSSECYNHNLRQISLMA